MSPQNLNEGECESMGVILYTYQNGVYVNLTNKCTCNCVFCIRRKQDAVNGEEDMWHNTDPTYQEVVDAIDKFDFSGYEELVYCGYGEPTCALEVLLKTAAYFKKKHSQKIRVNTNGLGRLYNKRDILAELNEVVDAYSVSLNAPNKERYNEIARPIYEDAFDEMLKFAKDCKAAGKKVQLSAVTYIGQEEVEECRSLARELDIPVKIRNYVN